MQEVFCREHFEELFAEKCTKCKKKLESNYMAFEEQKYHKVARFPS